MSNKEQFTHNLKKAQRQRIAENDIKTQISNSPGFSKIANLHTQIISDRLQNNLNNLTNYIDFKKICKDFKLRDGDLTPSQQGSIEQILKEFIKQNSSFYEI
tara:strand:- start:126 stop:431 length:306 start_codon:yes stop_codon:yes gene_type:complete